MTDLYLVAHKVRGEPAFDIAERMPCPECAPAGCDECESLGYWWIIPTSGHRAYPWWFVCLTNIDDTYELTFSNHSFIIDHHRNISGEMNGPPSMPDPWPDHYPSTATPTFTGSLLTKLGLRKRAEPITRRM